MRRCTNQSFQRITGAKSPHHTMRSTSSAARLPSAARQTSPAAYARVGTANKPPTCAKALALPGHAARTMLFQARTKLISAQNLQFCDSFDLFRFLVPVLPLQHDSLTAAGSGCNRNRWNPLHHKVATADLFLSDAACLRSMSRHWQSTGFASATIRFPGSSVAGTGSWNERAPHVFSSAGRGLLD